MIPNRIVVTSVAACLFIALSLLPAGKGVRVAPFDTYGKAIRGGAVPYRDFSLEYPPASLLPIAIPAFVPAVPYTTAFRWLEALLGGLTVAAIGFLRRGASAAGFGASLVAVTGIPVFLGPLVTFRYDLWPSFLVLAGIAALASSRARTGGLFAGVAVAAKLYAVCVLLPLALLARRRHALRPALAGGVAGLCVWFLPFVVVAPGGVAFSLERQGHRHLQLESLAASLLEIVHRGRIRTVFEDGAWDIQGPWTAAVQYGFLAAGIVMIAGLWFLAYRRRDVGGALPFCAAVVAVLIVCSNVLSPQYLVWLVPLGAAVGGAAGVTASAFLVGAEVLSRVIYPSHYDALVALHGTEIGLLAARNGLVVLAAAALVTAIRPARAVEASISFADPSDA